MRDFKFLKKNKVYRPGDSVGIICYSRQEYNEWMLKRRSEIPIINELISKHDVINGVRYKSIIRPQDVRGYRFVDVITLDLAHLNPHIEAINMNLQYCLVNETI